METVFDPLWRARPRAQQHTRTTVSSWWRPSFGRARPGSIAPSSGPLGTPRDRSAATDVAVHAQHAQPALGLLGAHIATGSEDRARARTTLASGDSFGV